MCFRKKYPPKTFWNIFTSVKSFCVKFCKFVGNLYPHYQFLYMYLNISSNGVNFFTSAHRFHHFNFEYSPIKWKCGGRSPSAWFTQNGWASEVDSTADFLNSAELPPFVRVNRKWLILHQVLTHETSACTVCRCKTLFPLPSLKTMSVKC